MEVPINILATWYTSIVFFFESCHIEALVSTLKDAGGDEFFMIINI